MHSADGSGSVWFGDLMRSARRRKSAKCVKSNGDPGAIRTRDWPAASTRCGLIGRYSEAPLPPPPASEAVLEIAQQAVFNTLFGNLDSVPQCHEVPRDAIG